MLFHKAKSLWPRVVLSVNSKSSSLAVRLTKWTGKSSENIHPKHLLPADSGNSWYVGHIGAGHSVLDLGCGNGVHSIRAARLCGCRVTALDRNEAQLEIARNLSEEQGVANVEFKFWDLDKKLPFASACFDRILLLDVIEHLDGRQDVLIEAARTLKPDGLLVLSAPNVDTAWKRRLKQAGLFHYADPDHKIEYTWPSLIKELADGGFVVEGEPAIVVYDTPWAGLIDLVGGVSLSAYRRLARWKVTRAQRYPGETSGWRLVCRKPAPGN